MSSSAGFGAPNEVAGVLHGSWCNLIFTNAVRFLCALSFRYDGEVLLLYILLGLESRVARVFLYLVFETCRGLLTSRGSYTDLKTVDNLE